MALQEHGSAELASALDAIGSGLKQLDQAADDTVTLIVARAKSLAPKATGKLSRSIAGRGTGSTATVSTSVDYAAPVHFGVPSRNMRPRPFLYGAVDAERTRIVAAYERNVQSLIERKV